MTQTTGTRMYTKNEILEKFGIRNNAYYDRINFLGIKPKRKNKASFLSSEQVDLMEGLDQHIKKTGKMEGFDKSIFQGEGDSNLDKGSNEIVKSGGHDITTDEDDDLETLEPETESFNPNFEQLMREAAELKASELAMADLVKRAIANEMSEEDLPPDLKEKLNLAREISRPKNNPAKVKSIAKNLLSQYRNQGGN